VSDQVTGTADATITSQTPPADGSQAEAGPKPHVLPGGYLWGTGRRKSAVARVRIRPGQGAFLINKREIDDYFREDRDRKAVVAPLEATGNMGKFDVWVSIQGGGFTGQAGAIVLGVARALRAYDVAYEATLRDGGYLTRDSREKERKKYGQRGARRRFQFSKR